MKTFDAETLAQWRRWLGDHDDSEAEVWLIFPKRHTGRASIAYEDALDEALCFGWIDSLIKRLDDEHCPPGSAILKQPWFRPPLPPLFALTQELTKADW